MQTEEVMCFLLDDVCSGIKEGIPRMPIRKMAAKKREFQLQFAGIKENKIHSERLTSSPPAVTQLAAAAHSSIIYSQ